MTAQDVVAEHLPEVQRFASEIRETRDEKKRAAELRRISTLIRFMRAFYEVFLQDGLGVRVQGFSYRDKRQVSRRLIREEDRAVGLITDRGRESSLALAAQFEDLSDLLHGDLEFGYSDEDEDYEQFHVEAFPEWLEAVEQWLRTADRDHDSELANSVRVATQDYVSAVRAAY
jgi:hypothetical protein